MSGSNQGTGKTIENINLFDDGIQCRFIKSTWGAFTKVKVKSFFKKDTVTRTSFIGRKNPQNSLALYLCNWGDELKVSGTTKILGDLKLPNGRFKKSSILGNSQLNRPVISGLITSSNQSLPEILIESNPLPERTTQIKLSKIKTNQQIFNDFESPTLLVDVAKTERITNFNLKGNILLKSNDTIYIESSSRLEDVIISAPKVVIQNGFQGSIQVFADKEIVIDSNVILTYPSALFIFSKTNEFSKNITISKNAQIYGGIVLGGASFDQREANTIVIKKGALIVGDIYCNGKLELQGKVLGTVLSHKLNLETKNGSYENTLLNAEINASDRPKGALSPFLSFKNEESNYNVIKNL
ncbi:hypothetical protein [Allomuricauda sp. R78024]|uniref:hypothetical protein n=1 Tax=Allomuricauda sp. R78024 TaxID=3093867 RepID=UPI0037C87828